MKIAIVGAGVGGMALASELSKSNFDVTVFERFSKPAPVGSGLIISPVGQSILSAIGAGENALSFGRRIYNMQGTEQRSGRTALRVKIDTEGGDRFGLAIHRASLFQALFDNCQNCGVEFITDTDIQASETVLGGRILLNEEGEPLGPFDLVVDASGSNSTLSSLEAKLLPYGALWGFVNWPKDTKLEMNCLHQAYRRASKMIGVLPIGTLPGEKTEKAAIFWSLPSDEYENWKAAGFDAWKAEASALWPEFKPFVEQIKSANDLTMATYSHGTLKQPYDKYVAFIGDSARRTSPQLGQGANAALVDAWVLAQALKTHSPEDALKAYAKARSRHVWIYQFLSAKLTPMYQSDSAILAALRDNLLVPATLIPPLPTVLRRLISGDLVAPSRGISMPPQ